MLVLARKKNEEIHLPGLGVTISVTEIRGNVVRLGIDAPKDILIVRGELPIERTPTAKETLNESIGEPKQTAPAE